MSLTAALVALCECPVAKGGDDPRFTPIGEAQLDDIASRLFGELGDGELWVFGYGSLIWKPEFEAVEARAALLHGWHRSFCMELRNWRGTPQQPGLMMALDRGGQCHGVVFRLRHDARRDAIGKLVEREITDVESAGMVRWSVVDTAAGKVRCLVFWAGPRGEGIMLKLPLRDVAAIVARACGYAGSNAAYLHRTVVGLEAHGIRDRNLWELQDLVAAEIRTLHADRIGGP